MITSTPVKFEIYDNQELVATVTMFDEGASEVVIKSCHNHDSWQEVSRAIYLALKTMHGKDAA